MTRCGRTIFILNRRSHRSSPTWIIGCTPLPPKSDVNPSLAAGLNAVFLPHDSTWVLEHEVVHAALVGRELVQLKGFGELLQYF
jgi:putative hydrolase of the HAD superfamily